MLRPLVVALACASTALAAPPADLSGLLEPIRAANDVPALAAIVTVGGEVVARGVVGTRRMDRPDEAAPTDAFHYGSNGKALTATLVARLVEKGTLTWEHTLAESFPELGEDLHPDYRPVTLVQLLSHTGGLPENPSKELVGRMQQEGAPPREQRAWVAQEALTSPPLHAPGTTWAYSNVGYTLAGMACERATGVAFEALVAQEVFEPLGMEGVGFGAPSGEDVPWGHLILPEGMPGAGERFAVPPHVPGADNPPGIAPAGTLHAPLATWSRFLAAHLGLGPPDFLSRQTLRRLHAPVGETPSGLGYALGWLVKPGGDLIFHNGTNRKWYAFTALQPSRNRTVVVVTNQGQDAGEGAAWAAFREALRWSPFGAEP